MEYMTDTVLCKALFGMAFIVGLILGVVVGPRHRNDDEGDE